MVVTMILRSSGCSSCRLLLIRSFTSVASAPLRGPHISSKSPQRLIIKHNRLYSSLQDGRQSAPQGIKQDFEEAEIKNVGAEDQESSGENVEVSAIPWYLQVQQPQRTKTLSERQRIPDLPEYPPPILQPLLQQISVDLGLDDLTLLDLRKLDPPPALGANLIMVLGTARSEKHLHVSADRLCRWLRSNYKLRPNADGLLGRNELKLKLKRKAKRAKLMGSNMDANADDGIRTGWVCVDVGVVESAKGNGPSVPEKENYVGFGRNTDGVRIVIQMLTEEKREEIELEKLWNSILERSGKPQLEDSEESSNNDYPDVSEPKRLGFVRKGDHGSD